MILFTIGYEGIIPARLFETLLQNNVSLLVDVRELPISHKPGFAKKALALEAERQAIGYAHFPLLGTPREVRQEYRANHDWQIFSRAYQAHLSLQKEEVTKLASLVAKERCCLLCFERDYRQCHRLYLADSLRAVLGPVLTVIHLLPIFSSNAATSA